MIPFTPAPKPTKNIFFDKQFHKDWKCLKHDKFRKKFVELVSMFIKDPFNKIFRNHALRGDYEDTRSIDVTGDIRAIYILVDDAYVFLRIGSHSHLYG